MAVKGQGTESLAHIRIRMTRRWIARHIFDLYRIDCRWHTEEKLHSIIKTRWKTSENAKKEKKNSRFQYVGKQCKFRVQNTLFLGFSAGKMRSRIALVPDVLCLNTQRRWPKENFSFFRLSPALKRSWLHFFSV